MEKRIKKPIIKISAEQEKELLRLVRGHNTLQKMVMRANIILAASRGEGNSSIARELHISRSTVILWQRRLLGKGLNGLQDIPKPGRPSTITEEMVQQIVATTLSKPENATHWSTRSLAKEMDVSHMTVQRIWKRTRLQPHRVETFKYSNDPELVSKVIDVVGLYLHPPENALVLSVDEKSQIQALDRTQPLLPLRPGQVERHTHDYKRNGTTCLFAALNVAEGTVIGKCQPRHRHQEFLKFLRLIERQTPKDKDIHMILDNYATHKHPEVKEWLEKHPRYHLHFTPTSASWLNQVEIWFGILTQRRIRRGIFKSVKDLIDAIERYIETHNQEPIPFVWTKTPEQILDKAIFRRDTSVTGH
ncbi:MAG: IS630 family transposase [Dehalococcoidia bacterium]|nr:MAG: IS630 family transposase [Dehalococcoidia bacterium]